MSFGCACTLRNSVLVIVRGGCSVHVLSVSVRSRVGWCVFNGVRMFLDVCGVFGGERAVVLGLCSAAAGVACPKCIGGRVSMLARQLIKDIPCTKVACKPCLMSRSYALYGLRTKRCMASIRLKHIAGLTLPFKTHSNWKTLNNLHKWLLYLTGINLCGHSQINACLYSIHPAAAATRTAAAAAADR